MFKIFWPWSKVIFYLINLHIWAWSKIFDHIQIYWTWSKNFERSQFCFWTSRWIRHAWIVSIVIDLALKNCTFMQKWTKLICIYLCLQFVQWLLAWPHFTCGAQCCKSSIEFIFLQKVDITNCFWLTPSSDVLLL